MPLIELCRAFAPLAAGDCEREVPLRGHVSDEGTQPGEQRVLRRLAPEHCLALGAQCRYLVGVHGDEQLATVREVPVHGGVADACPASDLIERRVSSALAKDLAGGSQQQFAVTLRIRPARTPRLPLA